MHGAASVSSAGRGCARESARGYERLPMIVTDSQRPTRKRPIRALGPGSKRDDSFSLEARLEPRILLSNQRRLRRTSKCSNNCPYKDPHIYPVLSTLRRFRYTESLKIKNLFLKLIIKLLQVKTSFRRRSGTARGSCFSFSFPFSSIPLLFILGGETFKLVLFNEAWIGLFCGYLKLLYC